MTKRYYWLKFPSDFFQSMRVKALIGADKSFLIIYLKMMTKSVTTEGIIYHKGVFECIDDEIALDIDEDMETVKKCISLLKRYGLVTETDEGYLLPWVKGSIGSETSSAQRMRRNRASQCDKEGEQCDTNGAQSDTDIDIEIDIEKEEKRKKKKDSLPVYDSSNNPVVDISRIEDIRGSE